MKKILIFVVSCFIFCANGQQNVANMRIGTYNLRMDTPNDKEDAWPNRKEMVKSLVLFHEFDIFGTQEGYKHQLDGILEIDKFAYIGRGRDDGKDAGEHSAIVYDKTRFTVLDKGDFWYAENPEIPGKGWDATCCNRICSWAKFKDKVSGKEFYFFNSHYDHQGRVARLESSKLLLERMKKIVGDATFFCTGDFNATPESEPIQVIYNDGMLIDSKLVSQKPPYGTVGTYNSFKLDSPMKDRIDYIFVSKDIKVEKYGVLNDSQYGRLPSDHFPVMIVASF
jgi:Metal-dependent hydrolase